MSGDDTKDFDFAAHSYGDANLQSSPELSRVPVVLKHPENVIVVSSPTGAEVPLAPGYRKVASLTKAVKMASVLAKLGGVGCSIVVHQGLYVNPGLSEVMSKVFHHSTLCCTECPKNHKTQKNFLGYPIYDTCH